MPGSKPAPAPVNMVSMKTAREFLSAAKAKDPKRQQTLISKALEEVKSGKKSRRSRRSRRSGKKAKKSRKSKSRKH